MRLLFDKNTCSYIQVLDSKQLFCRAVSHTVFNTVCTGVDDAYTKLNNSSYMATDQKYFNMLIDADIKQLQALRDIYTTQPNDQKATYVRAWRVWHDLPCVGTYYGGIGYGVRVLGYTEQVVFYAREVNGKVQKPQKAVIRQTLTGRLYFMVEGSTIHFGDVWRKDHSIVNQINDKLEEYTTFELPLGVNA